MKQFFLLTLLFFTIALKSQTKDVFYHATPNSVKLSGYLKADIEKSIENWSKKKVPYAAFANFFSEGRPTFASGEMWGKAVRSACIFYWYTGDKDLKTILDSAVYAILQTERSNGSISCNPVNEQPNSKGGDLWERKYVLLGLERYYSLVKPDTAVLQSMIRQADCLIEQIGPEPKTGVTSIGWSPNHLESSTILEPVMRLYHITGFQRYLDFAGYIVSEGGAQGYNLVEEAFNKVQPHKMAGGIYPKAYEMMSFFEGLVEYYRATGDEKIKTAAINLFENVKKHEITIIGSGGSDAPYHEHGECWGNTAIEQTNQDIHRMMETCVGVTWMKFCTQILRLTGDPSAMDMIERYIYNGLIGAQKPSGDKFSYMNLLNGVKSDPSGWGVWVRGHGTFTCCDLNGPMGLAYIPYVAFMNSASGFVINLFNEGEFLFTTPGNQQAKIKLITDYPASGNVKIQLELEKPESFEIQIRIPGWSDNTLLIVDGKDEAVKQGTYHTIKRKWEPGTEIALNLDMRCRIMASPKEGKYQALMVGPVTLARDENMDKNFNQPVEIISQNNHVEAEPETPFYDAVRLQYKIPTKNGYIRMIDYASCDNWNGRRTCTWLPVK